MEVLVGTGALLPSRASNSMHRVPPAIFVDVKKELGPSVGCIPFTTDPSGLAGPTPTGVEVLLGTGALLLSQRQGLRAKSPSITR
jgi:hypothetical protein